MVIAPPSPPPSLLQKNDFRTREIERAQFGAVHRTHRELQRARDLNRRFAEGPWFAVKVLSERLRVVTGDGLDEPEEIFDAFVLAQRPARVLPVRTFGSEQLRAWRANEGILVYVGPHRDVIPAKPRRADGSDVELTGEFWLVHDRRVARKFEPQTWSIDDELGYTLPAISGGALYSIHQSQSGPNFTNTEELLIPELSAVGSSEVEGLDEVLTALAEDARDQREADAKRAAEGEARLAGIAGAAEPLDDPLLESARAALAFRVRAYRSDALYELLLAVLTEIAKVEPPGLVAWVASPFALACRVAAYDRSAPEQLDPSSLPVGALLPAAATSLRAKLERAQKELAQNADWAEDTDSHGAVAAYGRAASLVGDALARLEGLD